MNAGRLARRGLRHYWRTHLGVLAGVMCAAAVLVGALSVGDSVRLSLQEQALQRIGRFDAALVAGDRFVRDELAADISAELGDATCAAVLQRPGVAASTTGNLRTGIVDVFGIDDGFFAMSRDGSPRAAPPAGHAFLNRRLAAQLQVTAGDTIVVRVEKPSLMPLEATMATVDDVSFALRVTIDAVLGDAEFGRFALRASQVPPFDVFVSRAWLQQELALPGRTNLLLVDAAAERADAALQRRFTLADAELRLEPIGDSDVHALTSDRVFLDAHVTETAARLDDAAIGVLTYFVDTMRAADAETPYSMVAAIGPLDASAAVATALEPLRHLVPESVAADQIVLNAWAAHDLGVEVGDRIDLEYSVMNADLQFEQRTRSLRLHSIVQLSGAAADPDLMPAFPGLAEAESCRDWEPGIPVDLQRLDDADQKYWDEHRGTPKAFVPLGTGQALWSNRFGNLTAVRTTGERAALLRQQLPRALEPSRLGLFFEDLRGPAIAASTPATDFGALYLGLSVFLIVAALLLAALLFVFGIEQRSTEIGVLLAIGYEPNTVRWLFIREAFAIAAVGSSIGAALGVGYARVVLIGLGTLWRDTVGQTTLTAHIVPASVCMGAAAAVLAALLAIALTLQKAFRRPAVELLRQASTGNTQDPAGDRRRGRISLVLAAMTLTLAIAVVAAFGTGSTRATSAFFGGGGLLLLSALCACRFLLSRLGGASTATLRSVRALGVRNTGRRPGRSLTTIALLASGTFLVVAIQANRLQPPSDPSVRSSGTGGFALFGRSTLPVLRNLESAAGREAYALDDDTLAEVAIVPLRVRGGDDASCLNLSTAQNPQLVGVRTAALAERRAFRFTRTVEVPDAHLPNPWQLLDHDFGPGVVPAIGDGGSVTWALHKQLGDSLRYRDEAGNEFDVRIVGTVADSILQGNLVIADHHMRQRFPSVSGYRMLLVDAPPDRVEQVGADLTRALTDIGLELTPTGERLASFQSVQNTYLSIFQLLGGLGLLLGTVGLGIVVLRNALERRGELAVARAVGFDNRAVRRLVFTEHGVLLTLGLIAGVTAALLAILPAITGPRPLPVGLMLLMVASIAVSGAFWVWLASAVATSGRLLDALRQD